MAAEEDLILNVIEKTTGNALREGADDLDHLGDSADHASTSVHNLGKDTGFVSSEITRLRTHIRDLSAEVNRTGNTTLFKDIKADKSQLRQFENLAKSLLPVGAAGGGEFKKGFLSTMGDLGSSLRGAMIPAAIGMAAVASPIIGAAIAGAVVGGVGIGGIAGGIAAAAQDPLVKAAGSVFASQIGEDFAQVGHAFVGPVIESLAILEKGFRDMHLEAAFAKVAPLVESLARGIAGLGTEFMPGFNRALDAAGPALSVLAQELPQIGAAFGDMLAEIAESKGAVEGLHFVLELIESTLRATGTAVAWLSDRFHELATMAADFTGAMEDIAGSLPLVGSTIGGVFANANDKLEEMLGTGPELTKAFRAIGEGADGASSSMATGITAAAQLKLAQDAAADSAKAQAKALDDLKRSLDSAFNAVMSLDQANLAIQQDTLALKKAVDQHGASLSKNTDNGLANRRMLLGLVQDYERQREAASTSKDATAKATAKFNDQVGALRALAEKLGFSKSELDKLLGKYQELRRQQNITKTITIRINTTGATGALSLMGNIGKVATFDTGGWVDAPPGAPVPAIVHGGEFVVSRDMMKKSAMPSTRAPQIMSPAGGGRIELVVRSAGDAASEFIGEMVQRFVYVRGGDPQSALRSG